MLKNKIIKILKKNTWNGKGKVKYFTFEELSDQILVECQKEIIKLKQEFANTPLDKRGTGWTWLNKLEHEHFKR